MARKAKKKMSSAAKALWVLLVLVVAGAGSLVIGHYASDATYTPKFALDLEGGTQLILTPVVTDASAREITDEDIQEAISIIRQRVDASGVSEAEISTMGTSNIVVSIPGEADEETLELVRSSSVMNFRPVIYYSFGMSTQTQLENAAAATADDDSQSQSGTEEEVDYAAQAHEEAMSYADMDGDGVLSSEMTEEPENNSSEAYVTEQVYYDYLMYDCDDFDGTSADTAETADEAIIVCDETGLYKYLLGPVDVEGTHLVSATASVVYNSAGYSTGEYGVDIELDEEGTELFAEASARLYAFSEDGEEIRSQFAVVLDGVVISAPAMNAAITDGKAQITGSFTAQEARALANQLSFGSLPLNFEVQSEQAVSATLGSNHLKSGILAGVIGLVLVVLYLLYQYRGLAFVAAGSLVVAAVLTYLVITILSWTMGYRLSLAGVAGLIVAVGITADSFIVYFERIRDEVRDGRLLTHAVEDGWRLARRTIMISDCVNLLAAIVLYVLAVGGVQGFAFTLGVTTVVDLVVVFMFTHPVMSLLIRTRFFGSGHNLSGLDPKHLGAKSSMVYAGRGRVVQTGVTGTKLKGNDLKHHQSSAGDGAASKTEAPTASRQIGLIDAKETPDDGLSIAERRRLAKKQAAATDSQSENGKGSEMAADSAEKATPNADTQADESEED